MFTAIYVGVTVLLVKAYFFVFELGAHMG